MKKLLGSRVSGLRISKYSPDDLAKPRLTAVGNPRFLGLAMRMTLGKIVLIMETEWSEEALSMTITSKFGYLLAKIEFKQDLSCSATFQLTMMTLKDLGAGINDLLVR
jgi:hypothetical protein